MKADAQSVEQEALQWATGLFRDCASILTAKGSRDSLVRGTIESFLKAHEAAKYGKTDDKICVEDKLYEFEKESFSPDLRREVAAILLERNEKLPDSLREFVIDYLRNPKTKRKAGRDFFDLKERNTLIAQAVLIISERWKFDPTRNEATEDPSAASIIRDALAKGANLNLTEHAINKIWKRFGPHAQLWLEAVKGWARLEREHQGDLDFAPPEYGPFLDFVGINYDD